MAIEKRIYFLCDLDKKSITDEDLTNCIICFEDLCDAIDRSQEVIYTTQLSYLINAWSLIDMGYRVFTVLFGDIKEIYEHTPDLKMDLRRGHNVERLLLGGAIYGDVAMHVITNANNIEHET